MAKLVAQSGPTAGKEYPLAKEVTVLGRQSTSDVQVIDNMASRSHCEVRRHGGFLILKDSGSRNGTKVNDHRVVERQLDFGDCIRIGEVSFLVVKEPGDRELKDLLTRYQVGQKIGEGGMGVVYKAVQVSMQRTVALKVLSPKYHTKQRFIDQFIREARAAGALNHQNIIQVHDVGSENDVHFFSMEFVEGPTCARMLRQQGAFEPDEALEVVRQVARALEYAHEHRLIHQDIKPDNIMVGSDNVVKLADLGISKTFDEAEREGDATRKVMGTPNYMAPEAALGKKIDHRVDIYSLGATLYHLLAGKAPFQGATATEVLKAQVMETPTPLRQINPKVPEAVERLVQRMMAKQPDERPQSALAVQEEIKRLCEARGEGTDRISSGDTQLLRRYLEAKDRAPGADGGLLTPEPGSRLSDPARPAVQTASWVLMGSVVVLAAVVVVAVVVAMARSGGGKDQAADPGQAQAQVVQPVQAATQAAVVAPSASDQAVRAAKALDELEQLLARPAGQIDAVAAHNLLASVPQSGLGQALADRRQGLSKRLDLVVQRARQAQLDNAFQAVVAEVDRLAEERNYDLALGRIDAFPARNDPALQERVAQKRQAVQADKAEFIQRTEDRLKRLQQAKDLAGLKELRDKLPPSWLSSPQAAAIDNAIKAVQAERLGALEADANLCAKALAQWDFAALKSLVDKRQAAAQGTPAGQRMTQYADTAKSLQALAAALSAGLAKNGGVGVRYRGTLNGFADPDLMDAALATGLGLKEAHGGAVSLPWGKLKPADLAAVLTTVLGKAEADTYAPALAVLDQARAVK